MACIRLYEPADRDSVIKLWELVFPDNPAHSAPRKMLDQKLDVDELIFVAQHNRALVGACMAGYDGHRGWLYAVAVLPEHRCSGFGRQLVLHAIDTLKQLGCDKVNLQIRTANKEVADFYTSLGFEAEDRLSMGIRL